MAKKGIPADVKKKAEAIVARFNKEELKNDPYASYIVRFRGANLYLGHELRGEFWPVCRLTYTGNMDNWSFAIYKYSRERYDPDEWFFSGAEEVDGTIEGAMRAGLIAYPP